MNYQNLTIAKVHKLIQEKQISVLELLEYFLSNIREKDKDIKAFLAVDEAGARKKAKSLQEKISAKKEIPLLAGIPTGIKDNILVRGFGASAASKILAGHKASYSATAVKKLLSAGPIIILGKTNLDEFAMGSSTENSSFFTTKNPHDLARSPGGSSGGSAAAVAAGECLFALGSDTGGSIRQPAAFCGVVGLKPTYGSVSRSGLIALASSLDVIGPITKTVQDAASVFEAMSGRDSFDATTFEDYDVLSARELLKKSPRHLKIGIPEEYFPESLDQDIKKRIKGIIDILTNKGFLIEKISLPHTDYALAVYYILLPAEASANLARYDGIRYGFSWQKKTGQLEDIYFKTRSKGFGNEVKRRIMLGTYVLSAGYYDAYYLRAQKVREIITREFSESFKKVDLILAPTTPTTAFKIGEKATPLSMYLSDIFTVPANLAGLPALSLPCGKINNLPVALQIIAKPFREEDIFSLAHYLETEIGVGGLEG